MKRKKFFSFAVLFAVGFIMLSENVFASSLPPVSTKRTALLIAFHILRAGGLNVYINPDVFISDVVYSDDVLSLGGSHIPAINDIIYQVGTMNSRDPEEVFDALDDYIGDYKVWQLGVERMHAAVDKVDLSRILSGTSADEQKLKDYLFNTAIVYFQKGVGTGESYTQAQTNFLNVMVNGYPGRFEGAAALKGSDKMNAFFGVSGESEYNADMLAQMIYRKQVQFMLGALPPLELKTKGFASTGEQFFTYWKTECPSLSQVDAAKEFTDAILDGISKVHSTVDEITEEFYGRTLDPSRPKDAGELSGYSERAFSIMVKKNYNPLTEEVTPNIHYAEALDLAVKMAGHILPLRNALLSIDEKIDLDYSDKTGEKQLLQDMAILASDFDVKGLDGEQIVKDFISTGIVGGVNLKGKIKEQTGEPLNKYTLGTYIGWLRTAYNILDSKYETHTLESAAQRTAGIIDLMMDKDFRALMGLYINPGLGEDSALMYEEAETADEIAEVINGLSDNDKDMYDDVINTHLGWISGILSFWGQVYLATGDWDNLVDNIANRLVVRKAINDTGAGENINKQYIRSVVNEFEQYLNPYDLNGSAIALAKEASKLVWDADDHIFTNLDTVLDRLDANYDKYDLMEYSTHSSSFNPDSDYAYDDIEVAPPVAIDDTSFNPFM